MLRSLVASEMCIRDTPLGGSQGSSWRAQEPKSFSKEVSLESPSPGKSNPFRLGLTLLVQTPNAQNVFVFAIRKARFASRLFFDWKMKWRKIQETLAQIYRKMYQKQKFLVRRN